VGIGNARLVARLLVLPSLFLSVLVGLALATFLPDWLAAVVAFATVGPCVHFLVGRLLEGRSERWGAMGSAITVTGLAYPLLAWLGGTVYVAVTRSAALAVLVFVGPLVVVVVAALVSGGSNQRAMRAAAQERRATAAERGWTFVEDGTGVLGAHWSALDTPFDVTASSVLVGDIGGWPVTICDVVARRGRNVNRTVTCLVHLPVALPQTVALPAARPFPSVTQGHPWTGIEYKARPKAEELYLASSNPAFAERLATPEVRRATVDGDLLFWRIKGRDLSIAKQAQGRRIRLDQTLATASNLVALARVLPSAVVDEHAQPPRQGLPFRTAGGSS
jgi:hypothetical protein